MWRSYLASTHAGTIVLDLRLLIIRRRFLVYIFIDSEHAAAELGDVVVVAVGHYHDRPVNSQTREITDILDV